MGLLKRLFQKRTERNLPDANNMPIEAVWDEFVRTVRLPIGRLAIDELRKPEYAETLAWLTPPTHCALAKATMRALVEVQRTGRISQVDELAAVYKPEESATDPKPPERSLNALDQMCSLFRMGAKIFYQTDPNNKDSYRKIEITLQD